MDDALPVPPLISGQYSFFFDVDGTLAELQPRPEMVTLPAGRKRLLARLQAASHDAMALISGRSLEDLDTLTAPLRFALGGVHGAERRDINGLISAVTLPAGLTDPLRQQLQAVCLRFPGTRLEEKGIAFALHYRGVTLSETALIQAVEQLIRPYPELALQPGKCVVEIRPAGVSKGMALARFLEEEPFRGRPPLFMGDDMTDESAFDEVNLRGGLSIKVGEGETLARYRLSGVTAVYHWLEQVVNRLEAAATGASVRGVSHGPFSRCL